MVWCGDKDAWTEMKHVVQDKSRNTGSFSDSGASRITSSSAQPSRIKSSTAQPSRLIGSSAQPSRLISSSAQPSRLISSSVKSNNKESFRASVTFPGKEILWEIDLIQFLILKIKLKLCFEYALLSWFIMFKGTDGVISWFIMFKGTDGVISWFIMFKGTEGVISWFIMFKGTDGVISYFPIINYRVRFITVPFKSFSNKI